MEISLSDKVKIKWPLPPLGSESDDDIDTEIIPFVIGQSSLSEEEIISIALVLNEYIPSVRQ